MKRYNFIQHLISLILFIYISIISPIFADPIEKWTQEKIEVGEEVTFTLNFKPNEIELLQIPEKGYLFKENEDLPYAEITEKIQTDTSLSYKVVYFEPGEYKLKVQWKINNAKQSSSTSVQVTSVLTNEKEIVDIEPPIEFKGDYWLRAFFIIGGFTLAIIGLTFIIYLMKKKKPPIKDAIIQSIHTAESLNTYKNKIEALFAQNQINHKDFIFVLSGYIKEIIGFRLGYNVQYMNQDETNIILKNRYKFSDLELMDIKNYFNSIKYMPNDESISLQRAKEILQYWNSRL